MNFLKRAFWSMKAKKGKTLLQLVIFTVICVFVLSGLTIQSAAKASSELARQELGGSVTLQVDREAAMEKQQSEQSESDGPPQFTSTPISLEDVESIAALDHVESYNYSVSASANAEDFDIFESSTFTDSSDTESEQAPGGDQGRGGMVQADLTVNGTLTSDEAESFSDGEAEIVDGRGIEESDAGTNVAVIEQTLAEENDLAVGDTINISSASNEDTTQELEIVGIYETSSAGSDQAMNFSFLNPYNTIYVPYTAANTLKGEDYSDTVESVTYQMDDAENIDAFIAAAEKTDVDFDVYQLDANDDLYQQMVGPIENVASFAKNIVYLVTIAGAIILALIVMLSIRERKYEMGVLMAIGEKKWKLAGQFITEIVVIAIVAVGLSSVFGNPIANVLGNQLLDQQTTTASAETAPTFIQQRPRGGGMMSVGGPGQAVSDAFSQPSEAISSLNINVTWENILILGGIGLAVAIIAALIPSISILRLQPKNILTKQE
ncbi:ABC transporter permease [Terribacillus saccharophilus]|uniref:Macrolide ABC transporter permease n=1 Tax=Terribacillus saccharophilus TaxID=361277 RepID=A0A268A763_9BACI|nr:ABC transporter permease [Terribacillus saccharophilus]PAD19972.1 macrolide ABC transporter permease [Terribacillus saccharophilus]